MPSNAPVLSQESILQMRSCNTPANAVFHVLARLLLLAALVVAAVSMEPDDRPLVGGPCTYDTYTGTAIITRIEKVDYSHYYPNQRYATFDEFRVFFRYKPDQTAKTPLAKRVFEREHIVSLHQNANSLLPGAKYLKKYGIKIANTYQCAMAVIVKGTCTPIMSDFKEFDICDAFEQEDTRTIGEIQPLGNNELRGTQRHFPRWR